ncbi:hypothetical protein JTB14_032053 [Gonioctena quinquepunctata]|nr:hypothetical protein JTB14_032053 [Gonioctena quinquepunctata]
MESSAAIDKSIVENVIMGSKSQSDTSTKVSETECKEDLSHSEKTNEDDSSEQSNTKKSRELKLLLALSKEANLDTNISRKRKGVEVAAENKHHFKYPVTAESELEEELPKNDLNSSSDTPNKVKRRKDNLDEVSVGGATEDCSKRNRKTFSGDLKMFKPNKDAFCWRCHREGVNVACETCPRSYHQKCLKQTINNPDHWPCPECVAILRAENTQTRTEAMKGMTLEHLCRLLKFAVNRMIQCQGSEPFLHPVSDAEFPEYKKYIVQPMNLTMLLNNIKENNYGSTQAFEADAKWLLHNSIIFNSYQSKLTYSAKSIIKVCKQEMAEIENCPNCYLNANIKKSTWFVEVCPKPHILVWAKLKGFPYWPAKAMCTNSSGMVDVRFFGAHDRAWVHYKECFLYSEKDPNTFKQKRYDIEKCIEELNIYIENLRQAYGEFRYAPYRTPYDPNNETKQVQIFIPKYKQLRLRKKSFKLTAESKAEPDDVKEEKVEEEKASEDSSANPEDKFHVKPTDESLDHKDESRDGFSNVNSPENENDNDVTMEGYGTDDETIGEIDMERRKALAGKVNSKMEEDEEDDDTQVPSNISVESALPKRRARTPGGLSSTPGESKVLSRRKSEMDSAKKRLSTDETYPTQHKLSRRNSDQSVKSDSSRLSNISDKINRVDISENMEITLGNDDIGCVSISENISPPNGDSSRSGSDYGVEIKRKPVQVDIDNAEFSISPSSKLKISDQLIKRLSDAGDKIEGVKKSIVEKKSQTDILIEKFQDVVQHEVVDFNQPSTSSGDKKDASPQKSKSDTVVGDIAPVKDLFERESGSGTIILEEKSPSTSKSNDVSKENEIDCEKTDSKKDSAVQNPSEVIENDADSLELYDHSEETKTGDEVAVQKNPTVEITPDIGQKQKVIQTSITECTTKDDKTETESNKKPSDEDDTNVSENKKSDEGNRNSEMVNIVEGEETDSLDDIQIDKKNIFNIIHSSLNEMKNQNSINKELKNGDGHTPEETTQIIGNMIGSFKKDLPKSTDKSSANSNSIITDSSSKPVTPLIRDEKNEGSKDIRENEDSTSLIASANKKRKLSSGGMPSPQAKIVKLVPIESILNKNEEKVESPPKNQEKGKVVIKRLLSTSVPSSNSAKTISSSPATSSIEIEVDEIKSEPESDDDFTEMENLEAKRKYLSALNISEKLEDTDKNKANEIRTRAKAEEKREKCKIVII